MLREMQTREYDCKLLLVKVAGTQGLQAKAMCQKMRQSRRAVRMIVRGVALLQRCLCTDFSVLLIYGRGSEELSYHYQLGQCQQARYPPL